MTLSPTTPTFNLDRVYLVLTRKAADSIRHNVGKPNMPESDIRACVIAAIREAEPPIEEPRRDQMGTVLRARWIGLEIMGQRFDCIVNVTQQPANDQIKVVAFLWKCVPHIEGA